MSQVKKVGGGILHWLSPTPKSEGANASSAPPPGSAATGVFWYVLI